MIQKLETKETKEKTTVVAVVGPDACKIGPT
jgi:hypothetical protein